MLYTPMLRVSPSYRRLAFRLMCDSKRRPTFSSLAGSLGPDRDDVLGLRPLRPLLDLELDLRALR
ncbi:MAG: hypothetical protein ABSB24_13870, partial [Gaiellaceae bacterium]